MLLVTFIATLVMVMAIEFAIYISVLQSLVFYRKLTSRPHASLRFDPILPPVARSSPRVRARSCRAASSYGLSGSRVYCFSAR